MYFYLFSVKAMLLIIDCKYFLMAKTTSKDGSLQEKKSLITNGTNNTAVQVSDPSQQPKVKLYFRLLIHHSAW